MFLNWITRLVRDAVLKGFQEATEQLELTHDPDDDASPLAALKERMNALPAPSSNGDGKKIAKSKTS